MGNQVTTLGQIYPVEYYLVDYCNDMTIDASLGSTRFMKVARVRHRDVGYCVAKVYAINDPSIPIQEHKSKIEQIRDTIRASGELSSLPFLSCTVNEKCVILLRQYVKYNLYDRLSTRPFLTSIEKRWLAYQLLRCIQSLHKQSIYHGDIKSENVLVTSFLWVMLADFATYKPIVLPANNPSDFSYFFDTSRRHCCNMAPERFVEPPTPTPTTTMATMAIPGSETFDNMVSEAMAQQQQQQQERESNVYMNYQETDVSQLNAQMDLFSLGCVFAELFSDDTPNSSMFDLGQILMYKKAKYDPSKFIEETITDTRMSRLILNLTDLDPAKRNSASYHLDQLVPSLFPAYFQTLYDYFARLIPLSPDVKILTINKDLDKLMDEIITENEHGLLLLLLLATSTLRSLQSTDAKLIGLKLCVKLVECSSVMSEYIIDRLLPYIIHLLGKSSESRVRALCVSSLNSVLKRVQHLQLSDTNVFIDYILPSLLPLAYDTSTLVRIALASNISDLTETSKRFLGPSPSPPPPPSDSNTKDHNKGEESSSSLKLNSLQEAFGGIVSQLLVDPNNHVRRAILNQKITKLCDFFGSEKTDEVILSHIITFLNDKSDFRLRAAFFDNISCISSSLGPFYAPVVKPLMQKGLADSEEIVIYKCLNAITVMTESGLLTKDVIYELFTDAVLFLSFPNKWIRNAVTNFVLVLSKANQLFSPDEFSQRILPAIKLHLFPDVHAVHDESVLLDSLQPSLPRVVIESILNGDDDIDQIFFSITQRKEVRGKKRYNQGTSSHSQAATAAAPLAAPMHGGETHVSGASITASVAGGSALQRITATSDSDSQDYDTLTDNMISPGDILKEMGSQRQRQATLMATVSSSAKDAKLLASSAMTAKELLSNIDRFSEDRLIEFESILRRIHKNKRTSSSKQIEPNISIRQQDSILLQPTSTGGGGGSATSTSSSQQLQNVDSRMLANYSVGGAGGAGALSYLSSSRLTRPRGVLLAHLQEHKAAVNKLIVVPGSSHFISCSSDATIKFWDSTGVSTRPQVLFRSKQTFVSPDAGAFLTMSACAGTDTLLALTESNNLHAIQLYAAASSQARLIKTVNFNSNFSEPELVTDLISLSPYTYATCSTSSVIRGYDLRLPTTMDVWSLKMEGSAGLITCMDGNEHCIACGTSSSVISMFDLRFYIRATTMSYPLFQDKMRKRIRRILICNDEIYCSMDGNNEVSSWNCESASRTKTLWASPAPCLSSRHTSHQSVLAMVVDNNRESASVITAGDDMKIRFWDLNNPHRSYIVNKPAYNSYHKLSGAGGASSHQQPPTQPAPKTSTTTTSSAQRQQQQPMTTNHSSSSNSNKTLTNQHPHHVAAEASNSAGGGSGSNQQAAAAAAAAASNNVYYQTKLVDGIQVIQETVDSKQQLPSGSGSSALQLQQQQLKSAAHASGTSAAHHDSISCLATVNESGLFLSASRDGVIKIWR